MEIRNPCPVNSKDQKVSIVCPIAICSNQICLKSNEMMHDIILKEFSFMEWYEQVFQV